MASKTLQFYKCGVCGSEVAVVRGGGGTLHCCNQPMALQSENTTDAAEEKHVPVVEEAGNCIKVQIGSVEHPMEEKHYIKFIEVLTPDKVLRAELKPGMKPLAEFSVAKADVVEVREYCTVHDLWKA